MKPATRAAWNALTHAAANAGEVHLRDLFAADAQRFAKLSVTWNDWLLDYSKQRVTAETMALLQALWHAAEVPDWITRMRNGEAINHTEGRAALHIALRHPASAGPILHDGHDAPDGSSGASACCAQAEYRGVPGWRPLIAATGCLDFRRWGRPKQESRRC